MAEAYKKLELEELPKSNVVNSSVHAESQEIQEMIDEVVSEHLNKIVEPVAESESEPNIKSSDKKEDLKKEDQENLDEAIESNDKAPQVDINAIKDEFYKKGYEEAKAEYESKLSEKGAKDSLSDILVEKLNLIAPKIDIDSQIAKISSESVAGIAKKLHLVLPVNFEEIISKGLIKKLESFYTEGNIVLTINPDRYDFCLETLQSDSFPSKFKDNFQIVKDDKVSINDCSLDWNETRLEYNQEQLTSEIEKIIEQLKSA